MNSELLLRMLVHAYPIPFRERFATELLQTIKDQRRAHGKHGVVADLGFWSRVVLDVVQSASREHVLAACEHRRPVQLARLAIGRTFIAAAGAQVAFDLLTPELDMGIEASLLTAMVTLAGALLTCRTSTA